MFRHRRAKLITVTGIAALLSLIAAAVMGVSPIPVSVKLTPAMALVDTSALSPDAAKAEMSAVWGLFDRDTETAYMPSQTARITVSLPEFKTVSRIRSYGASSYALTVYRDNGGSWEPVPSLSGVNLTSLGASWNSFAPSEPFSATHLLFEFIPQGNVTAGIREIELWGPEASTGQESAAHVTLEGIATPQEALVILGTAPSHILEFTASPSELSVSDTTTSSVTIPLTQDPALFKRAYILYDGYNLVRSVTIARSINNLSWSGGLVIPQPEGTTPSWSSYLEEINPAWLVQGENKIDFKSASGNTAIRGLRLIVEIDSGWNTVSAVSASALYDGDTGTSCDIRASSASQNIQIDFERIVQPESIRLHVPGVSNLKAAVQYRNGTLWQDVKAGWQIDFATLQTGWNEIAIPAVVKTQALRLVFTTSSLRIRPGGIAGSVNELRVSASPAGAVSQTPRIVISYPRDGEYFGRTAYIQGFASPASTPAGTAQENIEGKIFSSTDGAFSLSLTKDETRFSSQPDDEAWDPLVKSEYGTQAGASLNLLLSKNSGSTDALTSDKESRGDAPFGDNREKFSDKVAPGQAKKIQFKGVTLDIPAGAVDKETEITIIPLTEADLARLNPGMINVTYPDAGYRFLPHGMKFLKPIKISFGYAKQLFAAGQVDEDVNMYYYDEKFLRWTVLKKLKVDPAQSLVESESDHFTDIINSTLVVPEHPQALSFNPNSIKDIKAADPSANIDLIEPPRANNTGTANLSYPIVIPKGRGAYTPDLRVTYSSNNANGWMGLGWDIPVSKIQVDTRWGVPRYDVQKETESYLLDGASLAPHAPRPFVPESLEARSSGEKVFRKRVEGDFQRIIRKKTSPNENVAEDAYYWEVTDKNGTKSIYGQSPQARLSSYTNDAGTLSKNIFQWNLEKVIDTNGNVTQFFYDTDSGSNGEKFKQLYLRLITYTKRTTDAADDLGPYRIEFIRSASRPDVIIDGKAGFQVLTRSRLDSVEVRMKEKDKADDTIIRRYEFTYIPDADAAKYHFGKSLLQKLAVRGLGGTKEFYKHEFVYKRMKMDEQDGKYKGFMLDGVKEWKNASTGKGLSHSDDLTKTITLSPAAAPTPNIPDFGYNGSYAKGDSTMVTSFMDMNGDGLPDRIHSGGGVELNSLDEDRESGFFGNGHFSGISGKKLGFSEQDNFSVGAYVGYWVAAAKYGYSTNFVNAKQLMNDVDGDGFVDHLEVSGGLQVRRNTGTGFEQPVTWNGYSFDNVDFDNGAISDRLKGDFYLSDPVRKWVAPYKGQVRVRGTVKKVKSGGKDNAYDPANPDAKASVRAFIYKGNDATPLWHAEIPAQESALTYSHDLTMSVLPGDRIYFRTNSIEDSDDDDVLWQPEIAYEKVCVIHAGSEQCVAPDEEKQLLTDTQARPLFAFDAGSDLRLAGFPGNVWNAAAKGRVRIFGSIKKKKTSDDVTFKIRFNKAVIWTEAVPADFEGDFTHEIIRDVMPGDYDSKFPGDQITFDVEADTTVDADLVQWRPEIVYEEYCFEVPGSNPKEYSCGPLVCAPDENNVVQCTVEGVNLPPGAQIEEKDIHVYGQPNYPFYYLTPTSLSRFWVAPYDGKVRVRGDVIRTLQGTTHSYVITEKSLAVARGVGKLLWKQWMPKASVPPSGLFPPGTRVDKFPHDFTITVSKGDQIFFDIQVQNFLYDPARFEWTPEITYSEYCFTDSAGQRVCKPVTKEYCFIDPDTGQQVCMPLKGDVPGVTQGYCDYFDDNDDGTTDRIVCTSTTRPGDAGPEHGGYRHCITTVHTNDPYSPQLTCQAVTCENDPIEGAKNCTPLSFLYRGRDANVGYKDWRYYYDELPNNLKPGVIPEAFCGGYRQWHYGDWNGNVEWDEAKIKRTKEEDVPEEDTFEEEDAKTAPSYFFVYLVPGWQGVPGYAQPVWKGRGENTYIASGQLSSSRLGKNVTAIVGSMSGGPAATINTVQQSVSETNTYGVSLGVGSLGKSKGDSKSKLDFMDMNGDRYPDQVSRSSVLFNNGAGGFYTAAYPIAVGDVRTIYNENRDESLSFSRTTTIQNTKGYTKKTFTPGPSLGLVYASSDTKSELIDINGDGLPDRVSRAGSDAFSVQLNLGYRFSETVTWHTGSWGISDISNDPLSSLSINPDALQITENATYSLAGSYWNIGGGASYTIVRNVVALRDVNGDGLADQILKPTDEHQGDFFFVKLNRGNEFGPIEEWKAPGWGRKVADDNIANWLPGANDAISYSATESYYISGGLVIPIPIIPVLTVAWIDISTSVSVSGGSGGSSLELQDINGDGLLDHVLKLKDDGAIYARLNNVGQTNLLKEVKRPLGGKFTIDYQREGNTVDMPQSQWVMKQVVLTDGRGNTYRTDYTFSGGYNDRAEREFYGFHTATETQASGTSLQRTATQTFYTGNGEYYRKGLLEKSVTSDGGGKVWAKTANVYLLSDVAAGSKFPQLKQTDTYFYDGSTGESGAKKSTYQTFVYDEYGNVKTFDDEGEVFTDADDVTATITYHIDLGNYIIKPGTILVTHGSTQLRKRTATYSSTTGNLETLTLHNTQGPNAFWRMTYDTVYGNLQTITDPVGYVLTYTYDDEVATYVTRIEDNFSPAAGGPYYSKADYNLLFGQLKWSRDLAGNYQVNEYDEFGRMISVHGPYDSTAAEPPAGVGVPTIAFVYTDPSISAVDNESLDAPARAVTYNKAVSVKGSDPIIIRTVTFVDGMKRIIQTKKDTDVNGAYGMSVFGKIVFDDLGRVIAQGQPKFEAASFDFINYSAPRNPTLFSYDTLDRATEVLTPDAKGSVTIGPNRYAKTTTIYAFGDVNGNPYAKTIVIDPEGNKVNGAGFRGTKISYKDVDDRIVAVLEYNRIKDPETKQETLNEIRTSYDYDPLGQITNVFDNKGNTTTVSYDDLGRRLSINSPDTGLTRYTYDANGNLVTKSTANNHKISYKYDYNRLMAIDYPNNLKTASVSYEYGAMGEAFNRAGRIRKVIDESGEEVRYYGKLGETTREEKTVEAHTPAVQRKKFSTDYVFDSFGRMQEMTYPDGEKLHYAYDNGGLLKAAWGEKSGNRYDYITTLLYDEYGQRTYIVYGNNTKSTYTYDELTRRLATLKTVLKDGREIQKLSYDYDLVGNVGETWNNIAVPTNTALPAGPIKQKYEYDDLYQIVEAKGWYNFGPGKENNYHNEFFYDTIGNFTRKNQVHKIIQPSTTETLPKETNYVLNYQYKFAINSITKPHAVSETDDKLYTYDNNGNMKGWTSKVNGTRRTIYWNEENRVKQIDDNGKSTYFLYDDAGERVVKRGQHGETIYVNRFFSIRNGELGTKSVYAGEARVVSKLAKTPPTNTANSATTMTTTTTATGTATIPGEQGLDHGRGKKLGIIKRLPDGYQTGINPPVEKDQFYYHGDHLGSSNMITDAYGAVYQHLEYFPYGESWIEEGGSYGGNTPAYKFTGKELDPETGLYYYGARYYDPVLSRWISADPILNSYLDGKPRGGVYHPVKLALYAYTSLNPVVFVDPTGMYEIYNIEGELKYKDDKSADKNVYLAVLNRNVLSIYDTGIHQDDFHKVAATVFGESGAKADVKEMIAIAHVIKNKGATAGLSMVESALKTVTTKKGKTVKWFYGAHSDLAKKYLDKLKHISMGAKGAGDKARKSRASVLDAVFNPVDPVGGATMFEGNVFLGPNRKEGSVFQEIYVDTGIAYDPVTFGETTFFKERSPSAAKKWRQENNIK